MRHANKLLIGSILAAVVLYVGMYLGRTELVGNTTSQPDGSFISTKWYRVTKTTSEACIYTPAARIEAVLRGQPVIPVYGPD